LLKTKTGKYKIDLPINNNADEVEVMVIVEQKNKGKKTLADFTGKLQWKGDAVAYQKMLRDEWR
jgi:hypothetical protein